jgi:hypothetical protein
VLVYAAMVRDASLREAPHHEGLYRVVHPQTSS